MDAMKEALQRAIKKKYENKEDFLIEEGDPTAQLAEEFGLMGMGSIKNVSSMLTPESQALREIISKRNNLEKISEPQGKLIKVEGGGLEDIRNAQNQFKEEAIDKFSNEYDRLAFNGLDNRIPREERIWHLEKALEKAKEASELFPEKSKMWNREANFWQNKINQLSEDLKPIPKNIINIDFKKGKD